MIRWSERAEAPRSRPFQALGEAIGAAPALQVLALALAAPLAVVDEATARQVTAHLGASRQEMGGLLLGQAYELPIRPAHGVAFVPWIQAQVASRHFDNSEISLRMEPELWHRATPLLDAGLRVLGWYHSHPDLGAFFSGTDRATQRSFFRERWSLGLVIDPVRGEHACYVGPEADEPGCVLRVAPSLARFATEVESSPSIRTSSR